MLVTFKTRSHSDISMFGDVAKNMLKMMGMSGDVPGALMPADLQAALTSLKSNVEKSSSDEQSDATTHLDSDNKPAATASDEDAAVVGLSTRAKPLIDLLEAAAAAGDNVTWEH